MRPSSTAGSWSAPRVVIRSLRRGSLPNRFSRASSPSRLLEIDPDALHLRVVAQAFRPEVAPEAGGLVAAERDRGVVEIVGVDPDRSRLEAARDGVRLLD